MTAVTAKPAPHLPLAAWRPSVNPWLIAVSVMVCTFMEVLDTSIANVALPHIAGSLSITPDEATWVLTSYLISNAIILPTTGWFSRTFGRKRFLLVCIGIFTVGSLACGVAPNIQTLIIARIIQGAGGGALQPSAQAIMLESFPSAKRGQAMAFYTFGIIFAPIIGPTLGGWITDSATWRWVFYINVPVGVIAAMMVASFIEDPPYIRNAAKTALDYIGFGLLAIWLSCLQVVLDKGQEADWFGALYIRWLVVIAAVAFLAFLIWELTAQHPVVNLRALRNRNFATGTTIVLAIGMVLYGTTALLPLFLQTLLNYPALQSGLAVSPRGFGSIVAILIIGRMVNWFDTRIFIIAGLALVSWSSFALGKVNLNIGMISVTWPIIVNGFAVSMLFIPLSVTTMSTLRNDQIGNATGIYNLMRNIGGAIGISITTTLLARHSQLVQNMLAGKVSTTHANFQHAVTAITAALPRQSSPAATTHLAYGIIYQQLQEQAQAMAYVHDFRLLGFMCLACIPLVLLLRSPKVMRKVAVH